MGLFIARSAGSMGFHPSPAALVTAGKAAKKHSNRQKRGKREE
jgi:hypothetical protein